MIIQPDNIWNVQMKQLIVRCMSLPIVWSTLAFEKETKKIQISELRNGSREICSEWSGSKSLKPFHLKRFRPATLFI